MDERAGAPVDLLMDRAGLAVALAAARMGAGYGTRVEVLCGPGNNGGDGYVAARYLRQRGASVSVQALGPPGTAAARRARDSARRAGVPMTALGPPAGADLIVDALFGGGFRKGIPAEVAPWFDVDTPVVAVDVPSGLDPDTGEAADGSFTAVTTVTFGALKAGHVLGEGPDRCGDVVVADIGLGEAEPSMRLVDESDVALPRRPRRAHKWSAGSVLVVGGSEGMVGAAVLAGRAALNFGAGAVGVVSSQPDTVAVSAPELLTYAPERLAEAIGRYGVVVVGPGLGDSPGVVGSVLSGATSVVVDADALKSVDQLAASEAALVLTPHAGEFQRLTGEVAGHGHAGELARRVGGVVLLKGTPTIVTTGGVPWIVNRGGPELATIGTGDVLAGMIGALWARGCPPEKAARAAAYWHGVAAADLAGAGTVTADRLSRHIGRWAGVRAEPAGAGRG